MPGEPDQHDKSRLKLKRKQCKPKQLSFSLTESPEVSGKKMDLILPDIKIDSISLDPNTSPKLKSSRWERPVLVYKQGLISKRAELAPCACYIRRATCGLRKCECPEKSNFSWDYPTKDGVPITCTCPVPPCKPEEDGQEFW